MVLISQKLDFVQAHYTQTPPSHSLSLQTSRSLIHLIYPCQNSYIHCPLCRKRRREVPAFYSLTSIQFDIMQPGLWPLSLSDKKRVWIPRRRGDKLKILDRYERERWGEKRKDVWQNKSIPGEPEQLMNKTPAAFQSCATGVNWKRRSKEVMLIWK